LRQILMFLPNPDKVVTKVTSLLYQVHYNEIENHLQQWQFLMSDREGIAHIFRAGGRRLTPQRRLLLGVLSECRDHLDAEAIYALAKKRDPHISLATVYRTLKVLKEEGVVQERILDREGQKHHYEMTARAHYHFTCLGCGRVIEFESALIDRAGHELAERLGLDVVHTRVHLDGYCPDCKHEILTAGENL
jgi:Fur family ferric uptake transcriptional regulator